MHLSGNLKQFRTLHDELDSLASDGETNFFILLLTRPVADAHETQGIASLQENMNETKFKNTYRIDPARLVGYDNGSNGAYFITICTKNKDCYFGDIVMVNDEPVMQPTSIGQRAIDGWFSIPEFSPFVQLDAFQLMPNHLHGIFFINKADYPNWQPNTFGPQRENLASILRGFKSGVTAYATTNQIPFCWQTRYYDRVIRNDNELNRIQQYIADNPARWEQDRENSEGLYM